jgi:pimeloyl-ACP methyl ester carboxylesterase
VKTPVLVLPGALGGLEGSALGSPEGMPSRSIARLDYRPDDTFEGLMARIASTADSLGSESFDVIGQSYGGWIAQCVAQRWPTRVRRLVLSHSFTLAPSDARYFAIAERLMRFAPRAVLAPLLRARIRKALAPVRATHPELYRRQEAALAEAVRSPRFLATLAAQQRCIRESLTKAQETSEEVRPVLIIESANDPLIGAKMRARLHRRYPQAQVHCFARAGHVSAVVEPEIYAQLIGEFLGTAGDGGATRGGPD